LGTTSDETIEDRDEGYWVLLKMMVENWMMLKSHGFWWLYGGLVVFSGDFQH
jgi:hypothetical protein